MTTSHQKRGLIDLTGQVFGGWTVICRIAKDPSITHQQQPKWKCVCECGTTRSVSGNVLREGRSRSCGCRPLEVSPLIEMVGRQFGEWTVVRRVENARSSQAKWECKCSCGTVGSVMGNTLRLGGSKSCGCKVRERTLLMNAKKALDLAGKKIGRITFLERVGSARHGILWKCQCDCGMVKVMHGARTAALGENASCGCYGLQRRVEVYKANAKKYELMGQMLTAEEIAELAGISYISAQVRLSHGEDAISILKTPRRRGNTGVRRAKTNVSG